MATDFGKNKGSYGVMTIIAYYSDKVIDLIVKSSYCQACTYFRHHTDDLDCAEHLENFTINHKRTAGKMEVDAVLKGVWWIRLLKMRITYNFDRTRFIAYLNYGSNFVTLQNLKPEKLIID